MVLTEDQEETDRYWNAIVGNGGEESACGWCKDKWGFSWQITPRVLLEATTNPDKAAAKRAFEAMMTMRKIDIAKIEAARRGRDRRCVSSPAPSSFRSTASCRRRAARKRIRPAASASAAGSRPSGTRAKSPFDKVIMADYDLLLGKRTYDIFAAYWPYNQDNPIGEKFQRINKYVLTHSDEPLGWDNSHKLSGGTADAVAELKRSDGRDLLIQGSSTLYRAAARRGPDRPADPDDLPGLLGHGKRIFDGTQKPGALKLVDHSVSDKGVIFGPTSPPVKCHWHVRDERAERSRVRTPREIARGRKHDRARIQRPSSRRKAASRSRTRAPSIARHEPRCSPRKSSCAATSSASPRMRRALPPGGEAKDYRFLDAERQGASPRRSVRRARHALHLLLDVRARARAALPDVHLVRRLARHPGARYRAARCAGDHRPFAGRAAARFRARARMGAISSSTRPSATISPATIAASTTAAANGRSVAVWKREGDKVRLFWAAEGGPETADPGFDPHLAPDPTPLWNILDWTPGGGHRLVSEARVQLSLNSLGTLSPPIPGRC